MRNSGHTLLELTVTLVLLSVMVIVSSKTWGPMNRATMSLRNRALASAELRNAVEALRLDLSGAESALPDADGNLLIRREREVAVLAEDWDGVADPGLLYSFSEGVLTRRNVGRDRSVLVSAGLSAFQLERVDDQTEILIQSGSNLDLRSVTLVWAR